MMLKNSEGVVLDYGVRVYDYEDVKYQSLMQDYHELQKEVDVNRSKLQAGKQRKMVLAAEVRFLRRRYENLVKPKTLNSLEKEKLVHPPNLVKHTKRSQHKLPPISVTKPKKRQYIGKEGGVHNASPVIQHHGLTIVADLDHKERLDIKKKTTSRNITPVFDSNQKERMQANNIALRNITVAFDLNRDDSRSGKEEVCLPSRVPIFDLNEISTGDEDLESNVEAVKFGEVRRSLKRGPNDEMQNELMLSLCRNGGEGPSRVGKRKISWQDPVALRA